MKRFVFDIEADDLLENVTVIHCICIEDVETGEKWSYGPKDVWIGLNVLTRADELIGHNLLGFDLPALKKLIPWQPAYKTKITDTLKLSKLCFPDLAMNDFKSSRDEIRPLTGSHGLKAWGIRLNLYKGDFGETEGAFKTFTPEMLDYCSQDVKLNVLLYKHLMSQKPDPRAVDLEHRFAKIVEEHVHTRGFTFNVDKAQKLCAVLDQRSEELVTELRRVFPSHKQEMKQHEYYRLIVPGETNHRERDYTGPAPSKEYQLPTKSAANDKRKELGLKPKDCSIVLGPKKVKWHHFNPGSRKQIADRLWKMYKWKSPEQTEKGNPIIDEETLKSCFAPESDLLIEYLMIGKRLGQIRDGKNGWLNLVKPDGRIYHRMDTIGCATTRCTHQNPNLSQVPSVDKDYGPECRECFEASPGYKLVGCDLSGIEARMMGHFLWNYDGGKFIDIVLNGDIHQVNADSIQCERGPAKNIYYAFLYGASSYKLCQMHPKRINGDEIKKRLVRGLTGLDELLRDVKSQASRGYLSPLDGRKLPVRSEHSAFNTLIQGSSAVIAKRWVTTCFEEVKRRGLNTKLLAFIHDETQAEVPPEEIEEYIQISLESIKKAQEFYKLKVPLDGEAIVGQNWKETH